MGLLKADGSISVKNHPVMKQLFQLRTIMEKIRPLDKRLQHQMDRLVNTDPIDEDGEESDGVTDMDEETEDHVNTKKTKKDSKSKINKNKEISDDPLHYRPVLDDSDSDDESE